MFGFGGWLIQWTAAAILLLGVMAAAGYYVFNRAVAGGDYVQVPNIVGLPITAAAYRLAEAGLELGRPEEVASDQAPEFHVIAQRPPAGKVIRSGRKVHPVVSVSPDYLKAPNLIGKTRDEAREAIRQAFFVEGTIARIPHSAPKGTVVAQEPPPGRPLARDATINLLLSDGSASGTLLMPSIIGKSIEEAAQLLAAAGVTATVLRVERPDALFDVVLDQEPGPGSLIRAGDKVSYSVRAAVPRQKREVLYTLPDAPAQREVRVDFIDKDGVRQTAFPQPRDYVDGAPPKFDPGTRIPITVSFEDEVTVEIFLDGRRTRSYYFQSEGEPIVRDYDGSTEGDGRASDQNSPLIAGE